MNINFITVLILFLSITSCGKRECDCDELYLDKDSVYRISNNGDKALRKDIARLNNLKHLINAIEIETIKMIDEKRSQVTSNHHSANDEMDEEEIKKLLDEEMNYEYARLEIEKEKLKLIQEEKEIEIKLQRAEIRSFSLVDTKSSAVYTGLCKSYYDNEKTKLKTEAEFSEGKITGIVKYYSENGTKEEWKSLLKK